MPKTRRSEAVWIEARGRWQINVQRDGKRKTFTSSLPGRKGKHEAEAKADDWLEAGQPDTIRFDHAWATFVEHLRKTTGTQNYYAYDSIGRCWLLPALGEKRLHKIHLADIQNIVNKAADAGRSAETCRNIKDKFFSFYLFAFDNNWSMEPLRSARVIIPKKAPKAVRTIIQPSQLKTLFEDDTVPYYSQVHKSYYIHAFRFIVLTGLRRGELCGLKNSDIKDGVIHIQRSINRLNEMTEGKTENANRTVPLTTHAIKVLENQQAMLRDKGISSVWVFPDENGKQTKPNDLYSGWRRYAQTHGIASSLHELRHTFVSITENDIPDPLLKRVVGHSEGMDTHGIYGHAMDTDMQRALGMMEDAFDRVLTD